MTAFDVLERQLHDATAASARLRRRRRRRRIGPVLALAAAAGVAALVVLGGGQAPQRQTPPADEREVVAPPVPFISPDEDKIVYVRATSVNVLPGGQRETSVTEDWHRGSETRRLETWTDTNGKRWAVERLISADGVMRQIDETGGYGVFGKSDMQDAREAIEQQQMGFLADFERRMKQGVLDAAGHVFAERPAIRYHVAPKTRQQSKLPGADPDVSYYVDRETGEPLGFTSELRLSRDQQFTHTQVVDSIEFLEPTRENLAKLREFTLTQR